ncbi:MAG: septal ring lytic transglycosylase RlpA family protein [Calditrichaeota bacterium]|nr:MAG: septal ring lytic transglycosylase RlpA family protein [Calditrichota bacterium]
MALQTACASSKGVRRSNPDFNQRERLRKDRHAVRGQKVVYGRASYYGADFHGRKTANGETFDMNAFTAAHRQWPFGTLCKVTNLQNGKSVVVRVNDRGPFVEGRIMDLSYGAARELGALKDGIIPVRIEILRWGEDKAK